jgi:CRP-like cAMP-binding protein
VDHPCQETTPSFPSSHPAGDALEHQPRLAEGSRPHQLEDLDLAGALGEILMSCPFLLRLRSDVIRYLANRGVRRTYQAGDVVIAEDRPQSGFFLILSGRGRIETWRNGVAKTLCLLAAGDFVGETAFVGDCTAAGTVRAERDLEVLEVPTEVIRALVVRDASAAALLEQTARRRAAHAALVDVDAFEDVDIIGRTKLVASGEVVDIDGGHQLAHEGSRTASVYVVMRGELVVVVPHAVRGWRTVATRSRGDVVGEMSLFDGAEFGSLWIKKKARLLRMERRSFAELLSTHPTVLERLTSVVEERELQRSRLPETSACEQLAPAV